MQTYYRLYAVFNVNGTREAKNDLKALMGKKPNLSSTI